MMACDVLKNLKSVMTEHSVLMEVMNVTVRSGHVQKDTGNVMIKPDVLKINMCVMDTCHCLVAAVMDQMSLLKCVRVQIVSIIDGNVMTTEHAFHEMKLWMAL